MICKTLQNPCYKYIFIYLLIQYVIITKDIMNQKSRMLINKKENLLGSLTVSTLFAFPFSKLFISKVSFDIVTKFKMHPSQKYFRIHKIADQKNLPFNPSGNQKKFSGAIEYGELNWRALMLSNKRPYMK